MKQITNSIQKVIARGRVDAEGNRHDWSEQDRSLEALTENVNVPVMVSPFERAVIEQLAEDWKDIVNNKGRHLTRKLNEPLPLHKRFGRWLRKVLCSKGNP